MFACVTIFIHKTYAFIQFTHLYFIAYIFNLNINCFKLPGSQMKNKELKPKSIKAKLQESQPPNKHSAKKTAPVVKSFQDVLSSDSDNVLSDDEKKNVLKPLPTFARVNLKKRLAPKPVTKEVIKLCSDSEEEEDRKKTIDTDMVDESGVPESPENANSRGYNRYSDVYDYTVVKNRESLASMTLNLDYLGEPLVESTRIHRRSSAGYNDILKNLSDSENSLKDNSIDQLPHPNKNTPNDYLCDTLQGLQIGNKIPDGEHEVQQANDTRYVTAVEKLLSCDSSSQSCGDSLTSNSSNPNSSLNSQKSTDKQKKPKKKKKNVSKSKITPAKFSIVIASSDSEDEMVEVVDRAIQTECTDQPLQKLGQKDTECQDGLPVSVCETELVCEELKKDSLTCWSKTINVYGEMTVTVSQQSQSDTDVYTNQTHVQSNSAKILPDTNAYDNMTLCSGVNLSHISDTVEPPGDEISLDIMGDKGEIYISKGKSSDIECVQYEQPTKQDIASETDVYGHDTYFNDKQSECENVTGPEENSNANHDDEATEHKTNESDISDIASENNSVHTNNESEDEGENRQADESVGSVVSEVEVIDVATQTPKLSQSRDSATSLPDTDTAEQMVQESEHSDLIENVECDSDNESVSETEVVDGEKVILSGEFHVEMENRKGGEDKGSRKSGKTDRERVELSFASIASGRHDSESEQHGDLDTTKPSFRYHYIIVHNI